MEFKPERIRKLRKARGFSLGTAVRLLSARCDYKVCKATMSMWERGKYPPGIEALAAICQLYEVDANHFFGPSSKQTVS